MEQNYVTTLFTNDLVKRALDFASASHRYQKRKYTFDPYIVHPVTVAGLVARAGGSKEMIAAALLHDVVEDCGVTSVTLFEQFGQHVAMLVRCLTDVSMGHPGNRRERKALDREHIAHAPVEAKTIKLADLIDNTASIVKYDPNFAKVYMQEKRELLVVLQDGDPGLYAMAKELVDSYFQVNL